MVPFLLILYFSILVVLAWQGKERSLKKTPRDFYLASGTLGTVVLFATLFATQYSGNTFMGFPGKAYRMGYAYIMSVTFMMAMVTAYLLYAPRLRRIAQERNFVTPGDWIHYRYGSLPLTGLTTLLMCFALLNFLLAQLMAVGHAFSGLTGGVIPYEAGVLFLALVIVLYETVGGMRAVAWTDVLQGCFMMIGITLVGGYLLFGGSELAELPSRVLMMDPGKVYRPEGSVMMLWVSTLVVVGLGGAMYPQAIQRIYAAKSVPTLKRALSFMVFMPLILTFFGFMIGIFAIPRFPGLQGVASDEVMTLMLSDLAGRGLLLQWAVALLLVGALAAIMSTADSVLLSLSSMLVLDLYAKSTRRRPSEEKLLRIGKRVSWCIVLILIMVAMRRDWTLWRLLEIKFEFLIQVAPVFILGLYRRGLDARVALSAVAVGSAIALIGFFSPSGKWFGMHPGLAGFIVNLIICLVGSFRSRED